MGPAQPATAASHGTPTTMTVRLIATGGTFDKVYDPLSGQLGFAGTQLTHMLERCGGWISQGHEIDGACVLVHGRVGHVSGGETRTRRSQQCKEQHAG